MKLLRPIFTKKTTIFFRSECCEYLICFYCIILNMVCSIHVVLQPPSLPCHLATLYITFLLHGWKDILHILWWVSCCVRVWCKRLFVLANIHPVISSWYCSIISIHGCVTGWRWRWFSPDDAWERWKHSEKIKTGKILLLCNKCVGKYSTRMWIVLEHFHFYFSFIISYFAAKFIVSWNMAMICSVLFWEWKLFVCWKDIVMYSVLHDDNNCDYVCDIYFIFVKGAPIELVMCIVLVHNQGKHPEAIF